MEQLPDNSDAGESSSIGVIVDALGAYLGRIPAALQRNVSKAVGHLFQVPNAYLDGLAEEIKATSEARVKITRATGDKLAKAVQVDSSLAEIATYTHANKILRHQKNATKVLSYAAEEISNLPTEQEVPNAAEISDDWLNAFESEAVNMSSDQMQRLFGKMLAGEIRRPSAFSIRTVKLMGQMDVDVAEIFVKFCSMVCSHQFEKGTIVMQGASLVLDKKHSSALYGFGVAASELFTLEEYGLIASASPLDHAYFFSIVHESGEKGPDVALTYLNKKYILIPKAPKTRKDFDSYGTDGIALSRVGRELLKIVEPQENPDYTRALTAFFDKEGLTLCKFPNGEET
jgi:hypothetical protein